MHDGRTIDVCFTLSLKMIELVWNERFVPNNYYERSGMLIGAREILKNRELCVSYVEDLYCTALGLIYPPFYTVLYCSSLCLFLYPLSHQYIIYLFIHLRASRVFQFRCLLYHWWQIVHFWVVKDVPPMAN